MGAARAWRLVGAVIVSAVALGCAAPIAAGQAIRYHGVRIRVPAGWPVFDLAAHPDTCVRFNRHAVYLGSPGPNERCPAHAVGRTEAILASPVRAGAADGTSKPGLATL